MECDVPIPTFSGNTVEEDVILFLKGFDRVAAFYEWTDKGKALVLPLQLEGNASAWFNDTFESSAKTYDEFANALRDRFNSPTTKWILWQKLNGRKQLPTETVHEYASDLWRISQRLELSSSGHLHHFVEGLLPNLREFVFLKCPGTVEEAEELAKLKEAVMSTCESTTAIKHISEVLSSLVVQSQRPITPKACAPVDQPQILPERASIDHPISEIHQDISKPPTPPNNRYCDQVPDNEVSINKKRVKRRKPICNYCRKRGHIASVCKQRSGHETRPRSPIYRSKTCPTSSRDFVGQFQQPPSYNSQEPEPTQPEHERARTNPKLNYLHSSRDDAPLSGAPTTSKVSTTSTGDFPKGYPVRSLQMQERMRRRNALKQPTLGISVLDSSATEPLKPEGQIEPETLLSKSDSSNSINNFEAAQLVEPANFAIVSSREEHVALHCEPLVIEEPCLRTQETRVEIEMTRELENEVCAPIAIEHVNSDQSRHEKIRLPKVSKPLKKMSMKRMKSSIKRACPKPTVLPIPDTSATINTKPVLTRSHQQVIQEELETPLTDTPSTFDEPRNTCKAIAFETIEELSRIAVPQLVDDAADNLEGRGTNSDLFTIEFGDIVLSAHEQEAEPSLSLERAQQSNITITTGEAGVPVNASSEHSIEYAANEQEFLGETEPPKGVVDTEPLTITMNDSGDLRSIQLSFPNDKLSNIGLKSEKITLLLREMSREVKAEVWQPSPLPTRHPPKRAQSDFVACAFFFALMLKSLTMRLDFSLSQHSALLKAPKSLSSQNNELEWLFRKHEREKYTTSVDKHHMANDPLINLMATLVLPIICGPEFMKVLLQPTGNGCFPLASGN